MKLKYSAAAVAVSIVMLGCQKEDPSASPSTSHLKQGIMEKSEQTADKVGEIVDSSQAMAARAKQEMVAAANQTLKELVVALKVLNEKASTLKDDAKEGAEAALAKLRQQRQVVADQLEKAKNASVEAWREDVRPGLESALQGLRSAYEDVKSSWPKG